MLSRPTVQCLLQLLLPSTLQMDTRFGELNYRQGLKFYLAPVISAKGHRIYRSPLVTFTKCLALRHFMVDTPKARRGGHVPSCRGPDVLAVALEQ